MESKQTERKKGIKLVTFFSRFIFYFYSFLFSLDFCGSIAWNVKIDKNLRSGSVASFHSRSHIFVVRSAVCSLIVLVRVFPRISLFPPFSFFVRVRAVRAFRHNLNLTKRYKWKRYFFSPPDGAVMDDRKWNGASMETESRNGNSPNWNKNETKRKKKKEKHGKEGT